MFAFLIWDTATRQLFGARDPFGIKPLFWAETRDGFAFSSEAKGLRPFTGGRRGPHRLAALPRAAVRARARDHGPRDPPSRVGHLLHPVRRTFRTPSRSAATSIRCSRRRPQVIGGLRRSRPSSSTRRIADVLTDSVAKHMRADVTVGAFLSGGIDSTAIAALAKRFNPDLITFTTGFEREGYSEVDVAAESAAAIGVRHVVKTVSAQELMDTLPLIVWYLDDPVADPALVPLYFVAREARKHVKVVLSGEGADELFGGYNIYREPTSLQPITRLPIRCVAASAPSAGSLPEGFRGKDLLRRGVDRPAGPLLRQRPHLPGGAARRAAAHLPRHGFLPRRHRPGVRDQRGLGSDLADAARRPVHLAARRHPGQGGQDDDGELARAAGAVPGRRGIRGRPHGRLRSEDHQADQQVRACARR